MHLERYVKLITLLSIAYLAATFVLRPHPWLLWMTTTLIVLNVSVSLVYLFRQGTITRHILLLNFTQLALFCRLHIQIHNIHDGRK